MDGKHYYAEIDYLETRAEGPDIIHVKNSEEFSVPSAENQTIRALATGISNGVDDGIAGIAKGVANAPAVGLNGATDCIFNCGVQGVYFQGSNPVAVPLPFGYNNAREASYGSASSTGTLFGLGVAGAAVAPSAALPSVVPETQQMSRGAQLITNLVGGPGKANGTLNKSGDLVITGERFKFRVDFKNPGNDAPHMHLQERVNDRWRDAVRETHRIYPKP